MHALDVQRMFSASSMFSASWKDSRGCARTACASSFSFAIQPAPLHEVLLEEHGCTSESRHIPRTVHVSEYE